MALKLETRAVVYYRRRGFVLPSVLRLTIPMAFVAPAIASYRWLAAFPASIWMSRYAA